VAVEQARTVQEQCVMLGRLTAGRPSVLLLDDAQYLRGSSGERLLRQLTSQRCESLRVVVASRGPLELGLSKLKFSEQVLELEAPQLRFDLTELDALLPPDTRAFASDLLRELMRATEGWPALSMLAVAAMAKGEIEAMKLLKRLPRCWSAARAYFAE